MTLTPPVNGAWVVLQGSDSALINHHFYVPPQRYALDLIKPEDGRLEGTHRLEDFASFGQRVHAPIQGRVVALRGDLPDGLPGLWDARNPWGNHLVIEAASDTYVMFLDQGTLEAKQFQANQVLVGKAGSDERSAD